MNILAYIHLRNIHRSTGAGRVARELIEHVAQCDGVNMHILTAESDHGTVTPHVGRPWNTFPYHLYQSATSVQHARWLFLRRPHAESYWPEAQIVHCTMESYVPTAGARLVVTAHDAAYFDDVHPSSLGTARQQLKWQLLYGTFSRTVDILHTVSHFSAERLAHAFPPLRSRLRVIHNAVSSLFFEPCSTMPHDARADQDLKGRRYLLVPGGLHHRKNAEMILAAWPLLNQRIPDLVLVIAGHNDSHYADAAQRLGKSVRLAGYVEDEQLRELYHHAQAVWFPSLYEGFGIPILEAMACGVPVVASSAAAIPEIAGGAALLANPRSVTENVEALSAVINDGRLRRQLAALGRKRAEPFRWEASARQLHTLYSSLV